MAGGDRAKIAVAVGANARALVTTQSAEKIYRCEGEPARVETRLVVESGGSLVWAPQETLLFESVVADAPARRRTRGRRVAADLRSGGVRPPRLGRNRRRGAAASTAGGFAAPAGWSSPRLCALPTQAAALDRPAVGAGARAIATILCVAPDAEARAPNLRAALETVAAEPGERLDAGASGFDGMAVARVASPSPSSIARRADRGHAGVARPGGAARLVVTARNLLAPPATPSGGTHESDAARKRQAADRHGGDRRPPPPRARGQAQPPRGGRPDHRFRRRRRARRPLGRRADGGGRACRRRRSGDGRRRVDDPRHPGRGDVPRRHQARHRARADPRRRRRARSPARRSRRRATSS